MIGTGERGTIWASPSAACLLVARAAHDVAARAGQGVDLRERAVDVGRLRRGHRLDRDRRITTDATEPTWTWRVGRRCEAPLEVDVGIHDSTAYGAPNGR